MADILTFMKRKHFTNVWYWVNVGYLGQPETAIPIGYDPALYGRGVTGNGGRKHCFWRTEQIEQMLITMEKSHYPHELPTIREARAFAKYDMMLYAKSPDGSGFVPVWEAETW